METIEGERLLKDVMSNMPKSEEKHNWDKNQKQTSLRTELLCFITALEISLLRIVVIYMRNQKLLSFYTLEFNAVIAISIMLSIYVAFRLISNSALISLILSTVLYEFVVHFVDISEKLTHWFSYRIGLLFIALFGFALLTCAILIRTKCRTLDIKSRETFATVVTVACSAVLLVNIVPKMYMSFQKKEDTPVYGSRGPANLSLPDAEKPNVFYILLDEYSAFSSLEKQFGYDNSLFLDYLEDKGFYVSMSSRNDTTHTDILTSNILSLDYVCFLDDIDKDSLIDDSGTNMIRINDSRKSLYHTIPEFYNHSYLFDLLRENGYHSCFLSSTYNLGTANADTIMNQLDQQDQHCFMPDEIEYFNILWNKSLLTKTSVWNELWAWMDSKNKRFDDEGRQRHEFCIMQDIDYLSSFDPNDDAEPNSFVYAHILCPHSPGAFYPNGEVKSAEVRREEGWGSKAYLDNVAFITDRMMSVIDHLIQIDPDCIIVLELDHGARFTMPSEAYNILNAVYYEGKPYSKIEGLSGVNTLRTVLSDALQIDLPIVEPPVYLVQE